MEDIIGSRATLSHCTVLLLFLNIGEDTNIGRKTNRLNLPHTCRPQNQTTSSDLDPFDLNDTSHLMDAIWANLQASKWKISGGFGYYNEPMEKVNSAGLDPHRNRKSSCVVLTFHRGTSGIGPENCQRRHSFTCDKAALADAPTVRRTERPEWTLFKIVMVSSLGVVTVLCASLSFYLWQQLRQTRRLLPQDVADTPDVMKREKGDACLPGKSESSTFNDCHYEKLDEVTALSRQSKEPNTVDTAGTKSTYSDVTQEQYMSMNGNQPRLPPIKKSDVNQRQSDGSGSHHSNLYEQVTIMGQPPAPSCSSRQNLYKSKSLDLSGTCLDQDHEYDDAISLCNKRKKSLAVYNMEQVLMELQQKRLNVIATCSTDGASDLTPVKVNPEQTF